MFNLHDQWAVTATPATFQWIHSIVLSSMCVCVCVCAILEVHFKITFFIFQKYWWKALQKLATDHCLCRWHLSFSFFFFFFNVHGGPLLNIWNYIFTIYIIHQSYNVISDARVEPVQCDLHRVLKTQSYEVNMQLLDSWHTCQAWNLETDGCIWSVICRRGKSVELMHPYHWLVKYTLYKVIREAELRATWVFQSGCWDIVFRNPAWSQ